MSSEIYRSIRMSPNEVQSLLSEMDTRARSSTIGSQPKREHARMEYRVDDVLIAIKHPGKTVARYLVTSRNLSAGGMSFLHGGFLHAGTTCFALLTDVQGGHVRVVGTVRSCRHVSRALHEVGVEFVQKIDPEQFCGGTGRVTSNDPDLLEMCLPTLSGQAMLVSEDAQLRRSITARITATGMTAVGVGSIGAAADNLRQVGFDVVLLDASAIGAGKGDIGQVRAAGYAGPIVCIVSEGDERGIGTSAEVAAVLHKPVRAEMLIGGVAGLVAEFGEGGSDRPVQSLLASGRAMTESIARFVEAAQAAGPELLSAMKEEKFERVGELCAMLRRDGSQTGFAAVGEAARRAVAQLDASEDDAKAERESSLRFLAGLCERVRPGAATWSDEEDAPDAAAPEAEERASDKAA